MLNGLLERQREDIDEVTKIAIDREGCKSTLEG
jgi:hypothetical protein